MLRQAVSHTWSVRQCYSLTYLDSRIEGFRGVYSRVHIEDCLLSTYGRLIKLRRSLPFAILGPWHHFHASLVLFEDPCRVLQNALMVNFGDCNACSPLRLIHKIFIHSGCLVCLLAFGLEIQPWYARVLSSKIPRPKGPSALGSAPSPIGSLSQIA